MKVRARVVGRAATPTPKLTFERQHISDRDFSGQTIEYLTVLGSTFERCNFRGCRVLGGSFGAGQLQARYIDCVFDGSTMRMGPGGHTRFERCSFRDVHLRDWFCYTTELVDCTFSGVLRKAIFNGAVPERNRPWVRRDHNAFEGNDFSAMALIDVGFRTGIDLSRQRLPAGPEYVFVRDVSRVLNLARREVDGWPAGELRKEALIVLNALEPELLDGQRDLFFRPSDILASAPMAEKLLPLLIPHSST